MIKSSEIFYRELKERLNECHTWPTNYLFKFIVENTQENRNELKSFFDSKALSLKERISSNSKYVSFTISVKVPSASVFKSLFVAAWLRLRY